VHVAAEFRPSVEHNGRSARSCSRRPGSTLRRRRTILRRVALDQHVDIGAARVDGRRRHPAIHRVRHVICPLTGVLFPPPPFPAIAGVTSRKIATAAAATKSFLVPIPLYPCPGEPPSGMGSRDLPKGNRQGVTARNSTSGLWAGRVIPSHRPPSAQPVASTVRASGRRRPTSASSSANVTPTPNAPARPASSEIVPASASAMQTPPRPAPIPTPR
jgi:hypothetical protein